ncbi:RING-H2 finger protein ATL74 [Hibiscus syriacus]|uniref:RING-type E3 ubiquitin transferase n=1 Tax=Hibiscus syriacus TaxID=106335 RepID=A0A6A3BPK0_HIBSY|nr:RING-H2 finger protein ATL74-like [Hibiscus syriacus]KAE8718265.1 RING-H2 finger protein ATL74 [Hibiscus syriacus]
MHRRLLETEVILPPGNGNKTHDSYISQTTFDTNMVVILAALLSALICALGLNSIVRCALRCSRRFAVETPEQEAATGLKKRDLKQIPVAVYGEGVSFPSTECPICLGEFVDGEKVRVLPKCKHGFHVRCIDTWLLSHSSCPNCRYSLLQLSASKTESSQGLSAARQAENGSGENQNGSVPVIVE